MTAEDLLAKSRAMATIAPERWVHVYCPAGRFVGVVESQDGTTVTLSQAYEVETCAVPTPQGLAEVESVRAVPDGCEPVVLHLAHVTPFERLAEHVSREYRQTAGRAREQRVAKRAAASGLVLSR